MGTSGHSFFSISPWPPRLIQGSESIHPVPRGTTGLQGRTFTKSTLIQTVLVARPLSTWSRGRRNAAQTVLKLPVLQRVDPRTVLVPEPVASVRNC